MESSTWFIRLETDNKLKRNKQKMKAHKIEWEWSCKYSCLLILLRAYRFAKSAWCTRRQFHPSALQVTSAVIASMRPCPTVYRQTTLVPSKQSQDQNYQFHDCGNVCNNRLGCSLLQLAILEDHCRSCPCVERWYKCEYQEDHHPNKKSRLKNEMNRAIDKPGQSCRFLDNSGSRRGHPLCACSNSVDAPFDKYTPPPLDKHRYDSPDNQPDWHYLNHIGCCIECNKLERSER